MFRPNLRRQAARDRFAAHAMAMHRKRRAWTRDAARVLLVAALVMLGVLAVEIGRKAVVVLRDVDLDAALSALSADKAEKLALSADKTEKPAPTADKTEKPATAAE